jgi:hypothetical protein
MGGFLEEFTGGVFSSTEATRVLLGGYAVDLMP